MAWYTLTARPEELETALIAAELALAVPGVETIDPESLRVQIYGKRLSDSDAELRVTCLYQAISAPTVTWHAEFRDPESLHTVISSPNMPSLRLLHYGERVGNRFDSKVLVIYSTGP